MKFADKRSILLGGHKTSLSLENNFWTALRDIASATGKTVPSIVANLDRSEERNLSSTIRLFVLRYYRERAALADKESLKPLKQAENERLRALVAHDLQIPMTVRYEPRPTELELRAENERLRALLKEAVDDTEIVLGADWWVRVRAALGKP